MTTIKIVYFSFLVPNIWLPIVTEQLDALKDLDLYERAVNIYFSVISDDNELKVLKILLKEKYPKIEIVNHFYENVYEYPGIKTVYDISDEKDDNTLILYFHSKGMTSNLHDLRKRLFNVTIKNYKEAIKEFENNNEIDVICALPHPNGFAYFNFFWIKSSYVKKWVPEPTIQKNRYMWEIWIGNGFDFLSKKKKIITYSPFIKYDSIVNDHNFNNFFLSL